LAHNSIVFSELLRILPRHEFEATASRHHRGRKLRSIRRWDQFLALLTCQLTGRVSLRDVVENFNAQAHRLYHLGSRKLSRSTLARVNEKQPASLYEEIFHRLLGRTREVAPQHRFRFKGQLISLDASLIELTASLFPWAGYQATKGAIKIHVGFDHAGYLPAFLTVTEGRQHEIHWARALDLPAGSTVVFDRGFYDYEFFNQLNQKKIRFVTRLKRGIQYSVIERRAVRKGSGLTSDQTIRLKGRTAESYDLVLRRVGYRDSKTGKQYFFLTNALDLAPSTIANVYRDRWQIELFFKWIKQNLKIKSFLGNSLNAVLSQLWVALIAYLLIAYLLVAYLKFRGQVDRTMSQILRLLHLNLFHRRSLGELLRPPRPGAQAPPAQFLLEIA